MDSVRVRKCGVNDAMVGVRGHLLALFSDVIANRSGGLVLDYEPSEAGSTPSRVVISRRDGEATPARVFLPLTELSSLISDLKLFSGVDDAATLPASGSFDVQRLGGGEPTNARVAADFELCPQGETFRLAFSY